MASFYAYLSEIEFKVSSVLMRIILPDERRVQIVYKSDNEYFNNKADYIVRAPRLINTIKILINPTFWVAECYTREEWQLLKGDLAKFLAYAMENTRKLYGKYFRRIYKYKSIRYYFKQYLFVRFFTRKVRAHYEIDSEIYSCFLDEEMVYTCAFFRTNDTLELAQENKYQVVMNRIFNSLGSEAEVLNIGCGWGSLERYLVSKITNLKVTGLSISNSQIEWARDRNNSTLTAEQCGRVKYILEDYINHSRLSCYDAIVAIGMVEHIGAGGYIEFFHKTYQLLKPGGRLLIHMIVKSKSEIPTNKWIDKYIFPGGYCPSIKEITGAAEASEYRVVGVYSHHPINYQMTLYEWRNRLLSNKEKILDIYMNKYSYNEEQAEYLYRQWEVYLAGSEANFDLKRKPLQVAQFLFEKSD